jgi:hypothetical protein
MDGYCKVQEDNFGFWEPLAEGALHSASTSADACE